mmetsp:Transcript_22307/g.36684  ORF Transcript_22307/g.36684 Transcript_22307/m.36684 type:complete len:659 (+) Transcript_22307:219-2195(+)
MTIEDFHSDALGTFKDSEYRDVSEFKGQRWVVDLAIWMNKLSCTVIDKLATTSNPAYPAPDMLQLLMNVHANLSKYITLVYAYDGIAPPHKQSTKDKRLELRRTNGADWLKHHERAKENQTISDEDLKTATAARMSMSHPTAIDYAAILKWMVDDGIEHYGSLYEADQQMIQLEKDGIVDGIISEDGDMIALGAKRLLCKMSRKANGEYQFKLFERERFLDDSNPYQSKLCKYPDLIMDAALLLGNDYNPRVEGNGPTRVLHGSLPRLRRDASQEERANRQRLDDSMLDNLAAAPNKNEWIDNFGRNGKGPLSSNESEVYWSAKRYMLHAPVLQYDKVTGEVRVVPLNEAPDDVEDLGEFLGLGDLNTLQNDKSLLSDIYHCNVIPIERKPMHFYENRLSSAIFGELDFIKDPISIQPTLCLVNYLRARNMDARPGDDRHKIEEAVMRCLRASKAQASQPLMPISGVYNGFKAIEPRQAGNEFDLWNEDCSTPMSKLEDVTDDVIDGHLGEVRLGRPSIRKRVKNLVEGGHYDLASIKCRNVSSKNDGKECILICCECLSSKSNTMHTVYAVFEDKDDGKYILDASSCSCKKGEYFCSHSIGFLYVTRLIQVHSLAAVKLYYRVSPKLVQSNLVLIENALLGDKFKQQNSRRKRQRID